MSAIEKALSEIEFRIPSAIRKFAFVDLDPTTKYTTVSERELIRQRVFDTRVLPDCNLVGGVQSLVSLDGLPYQELEGGQIIYRIPSERLQRRRITSALAVVSGDHRLDTTHHIYGSESGAMDVVGKLLNSHDIDHSQSTNRVRLIGENTILVEDRLVQSQLYLRCMLTNDGQLSNFSPKSWHSFAELCVLATQSYIYNQCVLPIDAGQLMGGVTIGRFRELIDQYSDSDQRYREYLSETFTKVSFQQDRETHTRHLKSIIGGGF